MRVHVTPLTDEEIHRWACLIRDLPAVEDLDNEQRAGSSVTFVLSTRSVSRALSQLRQLSKRSGARFNPAFVGEVALTLPSSQAPSRWRADDDAGLSLGASLQTNRLLSRARRSEANRVRYRRFRLVVTLAICVLSLTLSFSNTERSHSSAAAAPHTNRAPVVTQELEHAAP